MATKLPFAERYGSWALIAGASEGIGAAFARHIAMRGIHLLLVARRADALNSIAETLRHDYGVQVETASLDLASPTLAQDLQPYIENRDIGLCVHNAAYSVIGSFDKVSLEDKLRHTRVNCDGPLIVASLLAPKMVARGHGGIILMCSASGMRGTELLTTYAATKAFNSILAEGLWQEYRPAGVDVLGVVAGVTGTPNYNKTQPQTGRFTPPAQDPDELARKALDQLGRGYPIWHATWQVRLADILLTRLLPRALGVRFLSRTTSGIYKHYR